MVLEDLAASAEEVEVEFAAQDLRQTHLAALEVRRAEDVAGSRGLRCLDYPAIHWDHELCEVEALLADADEAEDLAETDAMEPAPCAVVLSRDVYDPLPL